jgi:hypothetical protein
MQCIRQSQLYDRERYFTKPFFHTTEIYQHSSIHARYWIQQQKNVGAQTRY